MARTQTAQVPEVGGDAPEFNLPSAQGGQLRLSMRTARGPVVLVFYADGAEEDVRYFGGLAEKEDEINMAGGTIVGIGVSEPDEAREFARKTGMKSYVLYDYARAATRDYGLLEGNKKSGEHARPAAFIIGGDHKIAHAWVGERPEPGEILAKLSEITGLPRPAEEPTADGDADGADGKPAGKAAPKAPGKPEGVAGGEASKGGIAEGAAAAGAEAEKPKKMSAEERERIKAERRAARAEGKSLKQPDGASAGGAGGEAQATERKRLSPEEREKRRAERRAARDAGGEGEAAKPEAGGPAGDAAKGDAGEEGEGNGTAGRERYGRAPATGRTRGA